MSSPLPREPGETKQSVVAVGLLPAATMVCCAITHSRYAGPDQPTGLSGGDYCGVGRHGRGMLQGNTPGAPPFDASVRGRSYAGRCTVRAHHIRRLNVWASNEWAAWVFNPYRQFPTVAAFIKMTPVGYWLNRLEAWLYDRQFPCEVPF